jgi:uroporphyrinogen III methyltransferase/synthase
VLPDGLAAAGATVHKIIVYENRDVASLAPAAVELLSHGQLDWIPLASPSMARRLSELLPDVAKTHLGQNIRLAAISPVTTEAACEVGLPISAEATDYTWNGLLAAIERAS